MTRRILAPILIVLLTGSAYAGDAQQEIQFLLDSVGASACIFTRNGSDHTAIEAKDHLSMKYRRAGKRIKSADAFIEHLATKSSWSGKPYLIRCEGESVESRVWLTERLEIHRASG